MNNKKMNISLLEPLGVNDSIIKELAEPLLKLGHKFTYYPQKSASIQELSDRSSHNDIVIISNTPYPEEIIKNTPQLKLLSVAFTGIDHIALSKCRENNITICNCANYSNQSVAELVINLTLSLYRKVLACDSVTRCCGTGSLLTGREIYGKTVGIIGMGKIGTITARLFQAFGAKVLAYSRSENPVIKDLDITYVSLEALLQSSDIVSLHVPSTPSTLHLISKDQLALMKKDAILINCARGPVVDNLALAEALQSGIISCAAIDVFDMEPPLPADYPLISAPNTILTPHIAYATEESMMRRVHIAFENVYKYLEGNPQNVCDLSNYL